MPSELVIGNGKLLVNIDEDLQIRDIYFPFVGQQNHVQGHANRIGIWIDGAFSWLSCDKGWKINTNYHRDSLVTKSKAVSTLLQVALIVEEAVHQQEMLLVRKVKVENLSNKNREIRLFFHQDLTLYENEVGDTAFFAPKENVMIHYKRNRYFLFNGQLDNKGICHYTTGVKSYHQMSEGTWRDAEDGQLQFNPISQGSVDSTFSLETELQPNQQKSAYFWMAVGRNMQEVQKINQYVLNETPDYTIEAVNAFWRHWVNKSPLPKSNLSDEIMNMYKRSLLTVRTQTNVNGYIISANDSDILQINHDTYGYMWPRDGALVAVAMTKAGYQGMVRNFYRRCSEVLSKEGFLHHKFNPDTSLHPYVNRKGNEQLPIQEDETALVLWALWQDYLETGDIEFAQTLYRSLIKPSAQFLINYIDDELQLPLPSYDLWEERRGVFTFTCSAVYGGLMAARYFAALFGEDELSHQFQYSAEQIREGMEEHLYDQELGRFVRGIYQDEHTGELKKDYTVESSLYGLFAFSVYGADDEKVVRTMETIEKELSVKTEVGGIARYMNDSYFKQTNNDSKVPGNPWIISTLWFTKWKILKANHLAELESAHETLKWVVKCALRSGLLPEQLHPYNGKSLSDAPLTWSHATFIDVVRDYLDTYDKLSS
ncbi:glycoside hydrolase family 15 protein [Anaerobacillus sp. MEB173]|uniref:glycoside hydrolase family 15 protein n=1 Tax=Anaerobacillus sp. MEB173 TaxID=3383345 RepID=UPI003F93DFCE